MLLFLGGEPLVTREAKAIELLSRVLNYFVGEFAFPEKMERLLVEIEAFLTEIEEGSGMNLVKSDADALIEKLEAEKAELEHALGFAVDAVDRLEAEKSEMLDRLEQLIYFCDDPVTSRDIESIIKRARGK